ncbi:MAG: hypothetical protein HDS14_07515 [Bacteroides sp.]|nr:hypothetical protein [Bacteroides sp.]
MRREKSRLQEATDKALEELRSRIGDTSCVADQIHKLSKALDGIDFYGIQLDAAKGSATLNYMFFLPDRTQISINSFPETLEKDVIAVNIFKKRKHLSGDFMTLGQLRDMLLS